MPTDILTLLRVYNDYVMLAIGGLCAIVGIILLFRLIKSRKKIKRYKKEITETMEKTDLSGVIDKMTATLKKTTADGDETLPAPAADLDISVLAGKYIIERELGGGGMSRVFLARNVKLGNQWIVKYIERSKGQLAGEEDILKKLNHISLPSIIDIFHNESGVFIVQSFIEGAPLDRVLKSGEKISTALALEWIEELTKVLSYLHSQKPYPIIHCDLKPSNIMITRDNRLVLIDFGISKQHGLDDERSTALTLSYAAPEQFKNVLHRPKIQDFVTNRFGPLPKDAANWKIDNRTDIFSVGVIFFELLTDEIPKASNLNKLNSFVSNEIAAIVNRMLPLNPSSRYASVAELLAGLQNIKAKHLHIMRSLLMRKVSQISAAALIVVSGALLTGGAYVMQTESLAQIEVSMELTAISEQQTAEVFVDKIMPNGQIRALEPNRIIWQTGDDNIARIEGNRIAGLNEGETVLVGTHRNTRFYVTVRVVRPIADLVDVSLKYRTGNVVKTLAGSGERLAVSGPLLTASFVSPESVDIGGDGTIYIVDAGRIRTIRDGYVETVDILPPFVPANRVRSYGGALYVLSREWTSDTGQIYGIFRADSDGTEMLYHADAVFTNVHDFVVAGNMLYFIEYNGGVRQTRLKSVNLETGDIHTYTELHHGAAALYPDNRGGMLIADSERGVIENFNFESGEMAFVAGIEGQRHFIDGAIPHFYQPTRIKLAGGTLFVLDFNVLRAVDLTDGVLRSTETVAGIVSTDGMLRSVETMPKNAEDVTFAHSALMDFAVMGDSVILTDPRNSVVWEIALGE